MRSLCRAFLERAKASQHRVVLANERTGGKSQALSFAELTLCPGKVLQANIVASPIALLGYGTIDAKMVVVTSALSIKTDSVAGAITWA